VEGRAEGKLEGQIEIAKKLLADGISADVISRASGLSIDEIENLVE
jgi:predicted transposase/invertase (TIGR01784 family)